MNYFELFELKMAPVVDKTRVSKKYFELQKKFHPDFFSNGTEAEKEDALSQSAEINKAFQIFQQDDKTLEYFLRVNGKVFTDEKYELPADFLMEMLDLNDLVMELSPEEVAARIEEEEAALTAEVAPILEKDFEKGITPEEMDALKLYHYKKKYVKRILDRLDQ